MRRTPRASPGGDERAALVSELRALYAELDVRLTGHACERSTDCCRFGVTGREPYVTSIELAVLDLGLRARGRSLRQLSREAPAASPKSRAGKVSLPVVDAERRCPLLDERGACMAYEARPLGCRTFYCGRATADRRLAHAELGALVRAVEALSERLDRLEGARCPGEKGRPLTRALATRAPR